jgi:alpha-beta hydrolase superfamily lysophospholipase
MKHDSSIKEIPGNGSVFFQSWLPSGKPDALIIVIHGFGEHSTRYGTHFADFYSNSNIGIFTFDLPGHGKTSGIRGHISNPFALLEIIDLLIKQIKTEYPQTPVFLYGHSFGGEVSLWYTLVRNPSLNGVIIASPLIGPKDAVPPAKLLLAKLMDKIFPAFTMDNGLNPKLLSRDLNIVDAYIKDPLVHSSISARSGMMVINRGQWILDHGKDNKNKMLVMIGSDEGIVNKASVDKFYEYAPNTTYKVWPGLFHELHNEPEKKQIFDFSIKWIMQNI